jgi:hypothetical protein
MMKALKERPVAEPIRMFGGSPIRVAVPPILEPSTSLKRKGKAGSFSSLVMTR